MSSSSDQAAREDRAKRIGDILEELYPNPPVPLDSKDNFTFLVAVMLSAQSTDKKVNEITPALFEVAGTPASMASMEKEDIQALIQQVGLAPTKAKNLKATAELLVTRHGGEVPATFAELEALPGVGHKTASVLMTQAHGVPSFPVDTHIHRLAQRWRLLDETKNVAHVEAALKSLYPESRWADLHLQIIFFGREYCKAQRHDPLGCPICSWASTPDIQPNLFPNSPGSASAKKAPAGKAGGKGAAKRSLAAAVDGAEAGGRDGKKVKEEGSDIKAGGKEFKKEAVVKKEEAEEKELVKGTGAKKGGKAKAVKKEEAPPAAAPPRRSTRGGGGQKKKG